MPDDNDRLRQALFAATMGEPEEENNDTAIDEQDEDRLTAWLMDVNQALKNQGEPEMTMEQALAYQHQWYSGIV